MGYIIEDGTARRYFWVVNYAAHRLDLQAIAVSAESDCATTILDAAGNGDKILYNSSNDPLSASSACAIVRHRIYH